MRFRCHMCGTFFESTLPQDPAHDRGYGTCRDVLDYRKSCAETQVEDLMKYKGLTREEAEERLSRFA